MRIVVENPVMLDDIGTAEGRANFQTYLDAIGITEWGCNSEPSEFSATVPDDFDLGLITIGEVHIDDA